MCGEKSSQPYTPGSHTGSPPRVRGKDALAPCLVVLLGITPACAGKRSVSTSVGNIQRDHPRVCGEKNGRHKPALKLQGSPPRVRGKGQFFFTALQAFRITPACAGKSGTPGKLLVKNGDHPRVCGEKLSSIALLYPEQGSPPRVRGKGQAVTGNGLHAGITPACAGKRSFLQIQL